MGDGKVGVSFGGCQWGRSKFRSDRGARPASAFTQGGWAGKVGLSCIAPELRWQQLLDMLWIVPDLPYLTDLGMSSCAIFFTVSANQDLDLPRDVPAAPASPLCGWKRAALTSVKV